MAVFLGIVAILGKYALHRNRPRALSPSEPLRGPAGPSSPGCRATSTPTSTSGRGVLSQRHPAPTALRLRPARQHRQARPRAGASEPRCRRGARDPELAAARSLPAGSRPTRCPAEGCPARHCAPAHAGRAPLERMRPATGPNLNPAARRGNRRGVTISLTRPVIMANARRCRRLFGTQTLATALECQKVTGIAICGVFR